jgi:hypothetical protein
MAISLWTEASYDAEADQREQRFTAARVAVAPLWSFLAGASTDDDFENRLALSADQIDSVCARLADGAEFAVLRRDVEAALQRDFLVIQEAKAREFREAFLARKAKRQAALRKQAEANTYPTDKGGRISTVEAAETMYGTGSPQHLKAIEMAKVRRQAAAPKWHPIPEPEGDPYAEADKEKRRQRKIDRERQMNAEGDERARQDMGGGGLGRGDIKRRPDGKFSAQSGPTVHLQDYGEHPARPASEVKAGMKRVYNFGIAHEITSVKTEGGWTHITTRDEKGKEWTKKHKNSSLIPVREAARKQADGSNQVSKENNPQGETHPAGTPEGGVHNGPKAECPICSGGSKEGTRRPFVFRSDLRATASAFQIASATERMWFDAFADTIDEAERSMVNAAKADVSPRGPGNTRIMWLWNTENGAKAVYEVDLTSGRANFLSTMENWNRQASRVAFNEGGTTYCDVCGRRIFRGGIKVKYPRGAGGEVCTYNIDCYDLASRQDGAKPDGPQHGYWSDGGEFQIDSDGTVRDVHGAARRAVEAGASGDLVTVPESGWKVSFTGYHPSTLQVYKLNNDEPNQWGGVGTVTRHPEFDGKVFPTIEEAEQFAVANGLLQKYEGSRHEAASGWSPGSGMGPRDYKPWKATHTYSPIGWDSMDARPHPGSKRIAPGSKVMDHGKMDPSGHLREVSDEQGNHQTVDKRSLSRGASLHTAGMTPWDIQSAFPHLDAEQRDWLYETFRGQRITPDHPEVQKAARDARTMKVSEASLHTAGGQPPWLKKNDGGGDSKSDSDKKPDSDAAPEGAPNMDPPPPEGYEPCPTCQGTRMNPAMPGTWCGTCNGTGITQVQAAPAPAPGAQPPASPDQQPAPPPKQGAKWPDMLESPKRHERNSDPEEWTKGPFPCRFCGEQIKKGEMDDHVKEHYRDPGIYPQKG